MCGTRHYTGAKRNYACGPEPKLFFLIFSYHLDRTTRIFKASAQNYISMFDTWAFCIGASKVDLERKQPKRFGWFWGFECAVLIFQITSQALLSANLEASRSSLRQNGILARDLSKKQVA